MKSPQGTRTITSSTDAGFIDPAIVQRAAEWTARLWSGDASEADQAACAAWRNVHAAHEEAWQRLQGFGQRLRSVPAEVALPALRKPLRVQLERRRAMQLLGLCITVGGVGHALRSTDAWTLATSDHRTATGEVRSMTLPDGTLLTLSSATAIDLRYTGQERLIVLRAGEVLVNSAPDQTSPYRPLLVRSSQGTVQALGTRFTVRQDEHASRVEVFEGAVEIRPMHNGKATLRLHAGQGTRFTAEGVREPAAVQESAASWTRGVLVADAMRLDDFTAELSRYRPGVLRCDPAVAALRVTGVFSLQDTDRALHNLTLGLPVALTFRSRYWVTVHAL
jgi:transmembrane sensor